MNKNEKDLILRLQQNINKKVEEKEEPKKTLFEEVFGSFAADMKEIPVDIVKECQSVTPKENKKIESAPATYTFKPKKIIADSCDECKKAGSLEDAFEELRKNIKIAEKTFKEPKDEPSKPREPFEMSSVSLHFEDRNAPSPDEIAHLAMDGSEITFRVLPKTGNESHLHFFMQYFIKDTICLVFRGKDTLFYDTKLGDKFEVVGIEFDSLAACGKFHYNVTLRIMN